MNLLVIKMVFVSGSEEVRGFWLGPAHQEVRHPRQPDRLREVQGQQAEDAEAAAHQPSCQQGRQEEVNSLTSHLFLLLLEQKTVAPGKYILPLLKNSSLCHTNASFQASFSDTEMLKVSH